MATTGRKLGFGAMGAGLLLSAAGVLGAGVSAQEQSTDAGPLQCENSVAVEWSPADMEAIASPEGRVFANGPVSVTISDALPVFPDWELNIYDVGSVDFVANQPIDVIQVRLWDEDLPGNTSYRTETFDPAVTSGTLTGSGVEEISLVRIKGIVFCAETTEVSPTSLVVVPTTVPATTTTVAVTPTSVTIAPEVEGAVQVLPQVETAPELAFTGSDSTPMVLGGVALVLTGLALVGVDRVGVVRRGRHSR